MSIIHGRYITAFSLTDKIAGHIQREGLTQQDVTVICHLEFQLSNNIFASTYTYVIPEKEKLIAQVEAVLEHWEVKEE